MLEYVLIGCLDREMGRDEAECKRKGYRFFSRLKVRNVKICSTVIRDNDEKNNRAQNRPHRILYLAKRKISEKQQCVRSNVRTIYTIGDYGMRICSRFTHINILLLVLKIGCIGQ